MKKRHTKNQIQEAISYWKKILKESHPPMDDFLGSKGTSERNQRDILKRTFDSYGAGYSADAFVAFARELAAQDPAIAKKLRQFFGQFASGSLDDKYASYSDASGNCSDIAKSLAAMLGTALSERLNEEDTSVNGISYISKKNAENGAFSIDSCLDELVSYDSQSEVYDAIADYVRDNGNCVTSAEWEDQWLVVSIRDVKMSYDGPDPADEDYKWRMRGKTYLDWMSIDYVPKDDIDDVLNEIGLYADIDDDYAKALSENSAQFRYAVGVDSIEKFTEFVKMIDGIVLLESKQREECKMNETKRTYTRRQIQEAIKFWKKQLRHRNFKQFDEHTVEGMNRIEKPMRRVTNDASSHVTVAELYEMADVLYDSQDDVPLNVGIDGEIYGQVNLIKHDGKKCVLTLAPYRNGTRSKNLSVDGWTDEPLRLPEVMHILSSFPKDCEVVVKMKDPYGFGPAAGKSVERLVKAIDVDSVYGIFLRVDD